MRDLLRNPAHNSVMLAYGITAAGKTYTIEGTREQPGVLPRALVALFGGLLSHAEPVVARAAYYEVRPRLAGAGSIAAQRCMLGQETVAAPARRSRGRQAQRLRPTWPMIVLSALPPAAPALACSPPPPLPPLAGVQRADLRPAGRAGCGPTGPACPAAAQGGLAGARVCGRAGRGEGVGTWDVRTAGLRQAFCTVRCAGMLNSHNPLDDPAACWLEQLGPGAVCPQAEVGSADEALALLRRGSRHRQRAETGLNYSSSRSHSIFTVRTADEMSGSTVLSGGGVWRGRTRALRAIPQTPP